MAEYKLSVKAKELKEDSPVESEINGKKYAVFLHKGRIHVLDGSCTHEGGPLYDGSIDGDELICPWHSGAFNIDTGKASENTPWATSDIVSYKARVDEPSGDVFIEM